MEYIINFIYVVCMPIFVIFPQVLPWLKKNRTHEENEAIRLIQEDGQIALIGILFIVCVLSGIGWISARGKVPFVLVMSMAYVLVCAVFSWTITDSGKEIDQ